MAVLIDPTFPSYPVLYFLIMFFGAVAFYSNPLLMNFSYVLVLSIKRMSFYSNNYYKLQESILSIDSIIMLILSAIIILSPHISLTIDYINQRKTQIPIKIIITKKTAQDLFLMIFIYIIPLIICFFINILCMNKQFSDFYLSYDTDSILLLIVSLCAFLFIIYILYCAWKHVQQSLPRYALTVFCVFFALFILPPVKAQANKFQESFLSKHNEFLQNALSLPAESEKARQWFDLAARGGNPRGMYESAKYSLQEGFFKFIDTRDIEKAMKQFYLAALQGYVDALEILIQYSNRSKDRPIPLSERQLLNKEMVKSCQIYARYYLGILCAVDAGITGWDGLNDRDKQKFAIFGEKLVAEAASDSDLPEPKIALAFLQYRRGQTEQGMKTLLDATRLNNYREVEALYYLGVIYWNGLYAAKDEQLAEKYLQKAADRNHEKAEFLLAKILMSDSVSPESDERRQQGRVLLQRLSDERHPGARLELARRRLSGEEFPRDVDRAITILESLSKNGDIVPDGKGKIFLEGGLRTGHTLFASEVVKANYVLAKLYFDGEHVPQDIAKSKFYLEKPIQKNHRDSIALKNKIAVQ